MLKGIPLRVRRESAMGCCCCWCWWERTWGIKQERLRRRAATERGCRVVSFIFFFLCKDFFFLLDVCSCVVR